MMEFDHVEILNNIGHPNLTDDELLGMEKILKRGHITIRRIPNITVQKVF